MCTNIYIYICIYACVYIYIYIYIYRHPQRGGALRERVGRGDPLRPADGPCTRRVR